MKKMMLLAVLAAFVAGCATTTSATGETSTQVMTLDQALQKSAETRAQLEQAKKNYQNAQAATSQASGNASMTDTVKAQVKQKVADSKAQVDNEVNAWKEVLK